MPENKPQSRAVSITKVMRPVKDISLSVRELRSTLARCLLVKLALTQIAILPLLTSVNLSRLPKYIVTVISGDNRPW